MADVAQENTTLVNPAAVAEALRDASDSLSKAHMAAAEQEGDRHDLIGPVRDMIFGLNSSVESLAQMIEEGRFG